MSHYMIGIENNVIVISKEVAMAQKSISTATYRNNQLVLSQYERQSQLKQNFNLVCIKLALFPGPTQHGRRVWYISIVHVSAVCTQSLGTSYTSANYWVNCLCTCMYDYVISICSCMTNKHMRQVLPL